MNQFDEWAHIIAKQLKSDAELVGVQAKNELYKDSARNNFIRIVLEPFLPDNFAIGSGRVIDSTGNSSCEQDIIIYRRDFPQFNLPGSQDVFLYESVLATIQVKTKLLKKNLFDVLDQCASMAELNPSINESVLKKLAEANKLTLNKDNEYEHKNPISTSRFHLIGRPPAFVYAFSGHQTSESQLKENIDLWVEQQRENQHSVDLKNLPSVIATQGCFAWRNTTPFPIKGHMMMGLGKDNAPVRLIILQLMHILNRGLRCTTDSFGLKPNLEAHLKQTERPHFVCAVSKAKKQVPNKPDSSSESMGTKKATPSIKEKQPAPMPHTKSVKPVTTPEPVIENLSAPRVKPSKPVEQPSATDKTKPAAKPLSFYGADTPDEEYSFQPIAEVAKEAEPDSQKITATQSKQNEPDEDPFITTQVIKTENLSLGKSKEKTSNIQASSAKPTASSSTRLDKEDPTESLLKSLARLKRKNKSSAESEVSALEKTLPQLRN